MFSHRVILEEIKENEYNLNIPRYVDTFEEESAIDLKAASKQLKELDANESNLQKKIIDFCDDLGIDKPF